MERRGAPSVLVFIELSCPPEPEDWGENGEMVKWENGVDLGESWREVGDLVGGLPGGGGAQPGEALGGGGGRPGGER